MWGELRYKEKTLGLFVIDREGKFDAGEGNAHWQYTLGVGAVGIGEDTWVAVLEM